MYLLISDLLHGCLFAVVGNSMFYDWRECVMSVPGTT